MPKPPITISITLGDSLVLSDKTKIEGSGSVVLKDFLIMYDLLRKKITRLPRFRLCKDPTNRYFILKFVVDESGDYVWEVVTENEDKVLYLNKRDAEILLDKLIKNEISKNALENEDYQILKTEFVDLGIY